MKGTDPINLILFTTFGPLSPFNITLYSVASGA